MHNNSKNENVLWVDGLNDTVQPDTGAYRPFDEWLKSLMALHAIKNSKTLFEKVLSGRVKKEDIPKIFKAIRENFVGTHIGFSALDVESKNLSGELINIDENFMDVDYDLEEEERKQYTLWNADFLLFLSIENEVSGSNAYFFGFDEEKLKKLFIEIDPYFQKNLTQDGSVYYLENSTSGIVVSPLGKAGFPYISENYSELTNLQYEYTKTQISDTVPNGRLFILSGPPGTGKSFLVRGLINDVKNCAFVLIPSSQIGLLSDINFMPAIKKLHTSEKKPIILVMEDADNALLPRDDNNMSIISDILNLTDGIIGSIVDVRILATTNAKNMKIDKALKRNGRLGCNMEVGMLSTDDANRVLARLTENKATKVFDKETTLADVYAEVAESKMPTSLKENKKNIGFA